MINVDDRILGKVNENEFWIIMHVAKRMRSNRLQAWPSLETIAKDCRWSENTTRRWRDSLVKKGYLQIEYRPGLSNIYRFTMQGIGIFTPMEGEYQEEVPLPEVGTPPLPEIGTPPVPKVGTPPLPKVGTQKGINNGRGLTREVGLTREISTGAAAPNSGPTVEVVEEVEVEDLGKGRASRAAGSQPKNWSQRAATIFDEINEKLSRESLVDYAPFQWEVCRQENFRQLENLKKSIETGYKKKTGHDPNDEQLDDCFRLLFTRAWNYFRKIQKDTGGALHYTPTSIYRSYNTIKTFGKNGSNTTYADAAGIKFGNGIDHRGIFDPTLGY